MNQTYSKLNCTGWLLTNEEASATAIGQEVLVLLCSVCDGLQLQG
jgi:hypothetical protein